MIDAGRRSMLHRLVLAAACGLSVAPLAEAQNFPQRPIRSIVPFPAGASYDTIMRIVGNAMAESTGQPIIIENRPGASAIIGADALARATPDGHTIGMLGNNHSILKAMGRRTPYDLHRDFAPLMRIAVLDNVIVVHPSVPARDLKELVALMRANPDRYRYASGGQGGTTHLAGALLANVARVQMLHVPYKSGGFAVNGLVSGEVHLMAVNMISAKQHVPSGRLRALAVTAARRSQHMPDLPTTAELGFPGAEASQWYGVFAPSAVPAPILKRLEDELRKATARADVRALLAAQGADAWSESPAELAAFLREDVRINRETAREAGIKSTD
jgi:tripartite-type tricarboxylate transporter receptor subunit TctC